MTARTALRLALPWLALAALAVFVLVLRLHLSYDLGLFLPARGVLEQRVVVEQMTSGPGSRLLLVGLSGGDPGQAVDAGRALREALQDDPAFAQVQNGESPDEMPAIPKAVADYRFLLADLDWSVSALSAALGERMRDLAFGGGPELVDLVATDPYLAAVQALERLTPAELADEPWTTPDGTAVLLLETAAAPGDIEGQQAAVAAVRDAVAARGADAPALEITGPGAFAVELQHTIQREAQFRSLLAVAGLALVLLLAYRRLRLFLLAGIPLGFGFLCGLAVTALLFERVHGITLAFGFTLLGVAIDFPLHLFSHARRTAPRTAMQRIWPTLRAGAASTLLAYLALLLAGSPGLAQLGTFTAAGLVGAVAVTRLWLPELMTGTIPPAAGADEPPRAPRLSTLPAFVLALAALAGTWALSGGTPWQDAPESISPVPAERLLADHRLRQALTSVDLRYQVAVTGRNPDKALAATRRLEKELRALREDGVLADWRAATLLLPDRETLQERQARIPDRAELSARLAAAVAPTPFDAAAFAPFLDLAEASRTLPARHPRDFRGDPLAAWVESRLFRVEDRWVSLVSLIEPDATALPARLAERMPEARWIDLKEASAGLFTTFRGGVLRAVGLAAVLMAVLLAWQRLPARRIAWLAATVAAALATTALLAVALHGALTIVHLVALLLVFGLGLDYALFFSRGESPGDRRDTLHSVTACTASTTLAFGILGSSSIPFLHYIGVTTALGSVLSFALAWLGSRRF